MDIKPTYNTRLYTKEYNNFYYNIMLRSEDTEILYVSKDKETQKKTISRILNWVDNKYIQDFIMLEDNPLEIDTVIIKNICDKIIKLKFRFIH